MSRLLRNNYRLLLAVDSLSVSKLQRGFAFARQRAGIATVHDCGNLAAQGHAVRPHIWQRAIATLDSVMADLAAHSSLEIVLANPLVRYCVLPAMPPFTPMSERVSIASQCLRETYGDAVDAWTVRVNPFAHGDSMLCCAVDSLLLEQLRALAARHRFKLKSIQPALMHGFNAARRQLRADPACFVQIEPGRMQVALMRDGAWQALTTGLLNYDGKLGDPDLLGQPDLLDDSELLVGTWQTQLLDMVSRELLLAQWPPEQAAALTIYIDTSLLADEVSYAAPQHGSQPEHLSGAYSGWQFVYLAPDTASADKPSIAKPALAKSSIAKLRSGSAPVSLTPHGKAQ